MGLDYLGTTELVGSLSQEFEAKGRRKDKRQVTKAEGQKTQIEEEEQRRRTTDEGQRQQDAERSKQDGVRRSQVDG